MAQAQPDFKSFAKGWTLMQKCAGSALDYDMRVLPPAVVLPYAEQLSNKLRAGLQRLLGEPLSEAQWAQCALPTCFGGMATRIADPHRQAAASYWCSVDAHLAVLPKLAKQLRMPQASRHPEEALALEAKAALVTYGASVEWVGPGQSHA